MYAVKVLKIRQPNCRLMMTTSMKTGNILKFDVSASAVLVPGDVASGSFEMVAVVVDIEVVAINLAFSVVVARPKASET